MNNTIDKWGLHAIFPQVFLGCLMSPPPLFVHCIGGILLSELACSSARNLISSTPAVHFNTANKFVQVLFEQGYFYKGGFIAKWGEIIK